jgi:ribosomal protein S18 acetylase RimI-like enzyme
MAFYDGMMLESTEAARSFGRKVNSYLARAAHAGRSVEVVGSFVASVDANSDNPFRNYAIPIADAAPQSTDVSDLVEWFHRRERTPRLEYVTDGAPAVEEALVAAGFCVEDRLALMTVVKSGSKPTVEPDGIMLVNVTDEGDLRETAQVQNEAYGGGEADDADVTRLRRTIDRGGVVIAARDMRSGRLVGAGLYTPAYDGVTEIAGVGVAAAFRRRGVAGAVTAKLVERAASEGIELPFLMAGGPAEQRIYERIGFEVRASVLHISLPAPVDRRSS